MSECAHPIRHCLAFLLVAAAASCAGADRPSNGEIAPAAADARAEPFVDPYCPEALPAAELLPGVEPHHRALDYWLSRVGAEVD
ncbi:MAG: hypothetical protein ACJA1R_000426, partial [Flavobacteriales bacterium]